MVKEKKERDGISFVGVKSNDIKGKIEIFYLLVGVKV